MRSCLVTTVILVALAFSTQISLSGIVMQQVRYERGSSDKQTGNIMIQDNKLRFNDLDSNYSSIIDIDNDRVILIDHSSKTYISTSLNEYLSEVEKKKKQMEEDMKNHLSALPPDQQETVKELMKKNKLNSEQQKRSKLNIRKTDMTSKIAGEDAVKYEIYIDGKLNEEIWITERADIRNEMDFTKVSDMMKKFKLMGNTTTAENLLHVDEYAELFEKGFPIKTVDHSFGKVIYVEEVTDIKTEEIEEDEFQPRKDYSEKTLESLFK